MIGNKFIVSASILIALAFGQPDASAAKTNKSAEPQLSLNDAGKQLEAKYAAMLTTMLGDITKSLPAVTEQKKAALQKAREALKKAEAAASSTQEPMGKVKAAAGLVEHAKGKWIGGAEKGIAQAQAALKKATTDAQRDAAKKDLAKWEANKQDGIKALKERQAALEKAKADAASGGHGNQATQAALVKARTDEQSAVKALLAEVDSFLSSDKMDAKLVKCAVLAEATPKGLAAFAQQGQEQQA